MGWLTDTLFGGGKNGQEYMHDWMDRRGGSTSRTETQSGSTNTQSSQQSREGWAWGNK